jgi:hypothetical protein
VLHAGALVMSVLHQPLPVVRALSLQELFTWAQVAAKMTGREF